jgi:ribosomal protein S18 acetylase RimI-like enzyme
LVLGTILPSKSIQQVQSEADVALTAQLAHEVWTQHYTPIIGEKQVAYMLQKFQSEEAISQQLADGFLYFIIYYDRKPAGYLCIKPEANQLFLSKIYVLQQFRGLKLGKSLMNLAIQKARDLNLQSIYLTVNKYNTQSIKAYEKMGFVNKEAVVFDIGNGFIMDDYKMELNLGSFQLQ